MATLDELRLQQLLRPFENLNTGITSTTAATPFINTTDILNQYNIPGLQNKNLLNQDLINQIIADNQRKTKMIIEDNKVKTVPISYPNVSAAPLRFATDDQASFFFPTDRRIVPLKKPIRGIMDSTIASNLLYEDLPSGIDTSYGVANEPDVVEDVEEAKKSKGGLGGLLKFLVGLAIPGAGFLMGLPSRGLEGIRSLNQRLRSTDFAQSKTLADYLDARKYGGRQEREDARARTMAQARGIQKKIDRGEFGTRDTSIDRGRGSIPSRTTSSPRKTSPSYSAANRAFAGSR